MALIDKLTAIANAIRAKTGGTSKLSLDQMASTVASNLGDVSSVTAGTGDVIAGKVIVDASGNKVTGTLPDYPARETAKEVVIAGDALYYVFPYGNRKLDHINSDRTAAGETLVKAPRATVASAIGLTANKIVKGNTILGIAGTAASMTGNAIYYLNGSDECTALTGGWTDEGYQPTSYYPPQHTEYGLQFFDEANPNRSWHGTKTVKKIDVTDLATITFVVFSPNHFYVNYFYGGLYTANNTVYTSWAYGTDKITWTDSGADDTFYKVATLDVSEVTGSYYLGVYYYTYPNRGDYGTYYGILTKVIGTTKLPTDGAPTEPISIISNGTINTPIEGNTVTKISGSTTYKSGGYTQGSGYVETVLGTGKLNGLITKNKIDLTNYSTISITLTHEAASGYPTGENYGLSLLSYKNMSGVVTYKTNFKTSAQTQTLTMDIRNVTGVYHVCCSSVDKKFKVTNWTIS